MMKKSEVKSIMSNVCTMIGLGAGFGFSCVATEALKNIAKPLAPKSSASVIKWALFGLGTALLIDRASTIIFEEAKGAGEFAGELVTQFIGEPDEEVTEPEEEEDGSTNR